MHESLVLMKTLKKKPQSKNKNKNVFGLYHTINKYLSDERGRNSDLR